MTLLLQPATTLAVILGAQSWKMPGIEPSVAFYNSACAIREYLLSPDYLALPEENLLDFFDDLRAGNDQVVALGRWLSKRLKDGKARNTEVRSLLVYYVGHGSFLHVSQDYYLLVRETERDYEFQTGLIVESLANCLGNIARHVRRFIILDCCFAGTAGRIFQSSKLDAAVKQTIDAMPARGTVLLCSSSGERPSLISGDQRFTTFTLALSETLKTGDPRPAAALSFQDIADLAWQKLQRDHGEDAVRPFCIAPDQTDGDLSRLPAFPNPGQKSVLEDSSAVVSVENIQIKILSLREHLYELWIRWQKRILIGFSPVCILAALAIVWTMLPDPPVRSDPIQVTNVPFGAAAQTLIKTKSVAPKSDVFVLTSLTGAGMRGAAFSFGMLKALAETKVGRQSASLLDQTNFVTGVSGGAITAAYFVLKQNHALSDFRERFLIRSLDKEVEPQQSAWMSQRLWRAREKASYLGFLPPVQGATSKSLGSWLDENLFDKATFASLDRSGPRRITHITATDIENRSAFIFGETTFSILCSDIQSYPLGYAVAASASRSLISNPVTLESFGDQCSHSDPQWIARALVNPASPQQLQNYAATLRRYKDGSVRYARLVDGSLTDLFGLVGFRISRETASTPYAPLSREQAVSLRRAIFLIAFSGRGQQGEITRTEVNAMGDAAVDVALSSSAEALFESHQRIISEWQEHLVRWRCLLPAAERQRLGAPAEWNCRDVRIFVTRVDFSQLDTEKAARLNSIPINFNLSLTQVDDLIGAGQEALLHNGIFQSFLKSF